MGETRDVYVTQRMWGDARRNEPIHISPEPTDSRSCPLGSEIRILVQQLIFFFSFLFRCRVYETWQRRVTINDRQYCISNGVTMFQDISVDNSALNHTNMFHVAELLKKSAPTNIHRRQIGLVRCLFDQFVNLSLYSKRYTLSSQ